MVELGHRPSPVGLRRQLVQLAQPDGPGDVVHPVVEADLLVQVLVGLAVRTQQAHLAGHRRIVGGHHAALAGAHVLGGIEGIGHRVAERADALALVGRQVRLRRVVDHLELVLLRERLDRVDVRRDAVEMAHRDGLGVGRDLRGDILHIDLVRLLERVAEHNLGPRRHQHRHRGDVGPRRNDDLITRLQQRAVGELERAGPVGAGQADLRVGGLGKLLFESRTLRRGPQHARFEHLVRRRDVLLGQPDRHERHGLLEHRGAAIDRQIRRRHRRRHRTHSIAGYEGS